MRLLITASGVEKGELDPVTGFVHLDGTGSILAGAGRPSAETGIHLALVQRPDVGAVYHTHSVWGTILSQLHGEVGGFFISGYEMLKGLAGVTTHEHREWVPILANSQDIGALALEVEALLLEQPGIHGFYLRGHGLYTWGRTPADARRHVEIYEFLFEVVGRLGLAMRGEPLRPALA